MGVDGNPVLRGQARLAAGPSARLSYGVAVVSALGAVGARLALNPMLGAHSPYLISIFAIIIAAWFGGRLPGFVSTGLNMLGMWYFFVEPRYSFAVPSNNAIAALVLFLVVGSIISLLVGHVRESNLNSAHAAEVLRRKTQLVDLSHDAVVTADSKRRITGWNAGATEMYGWTESEAMGRVIHGLLQTTGDVSTAKIDEALLREGRWEGELNHIGRDGRRLVVESRQVLLRDRANEPVGILEINRDVTESKRSHDALRSSEAQFRTLANAIPQLCWMANPDGWIFWYNQRWYDYTGTTPDQMDGWGWQAVHDPKVLPKVLEQWRAAIATGQPLDTVFPLRAADGMFHPFLTRVMPLRDEDDKVVRWFGTNTDISEQRAQEEMFRQASELRQLALEAADMGAWDCRLDTGSLFWDERCRNIFGFPTGDQIDYQEAIGRIHSDDRAATYEAVKRAISGDNDGIYHREFRVVWPDGSVHWVTSHGKAFFDGQGDQRHAVRFVGVNAEITERKHVEERLRHTQRLESIGLLAGGIAHDFNNLLTVIMGSASSALAECPTCEHSRAILGASERAAYLTKQLLAYAGRGHTVAKIIDLRNLISKSAALLSASIPKRVILRLSLSEGLPCIEADPSQIEQVLMNLVINAGESIPPRCDGLIEIATSICEVTPEEAHDNSKAFEAAAGTYVCLVVRDNGAGMDEATISHIFDPFFTTKFTGRGMGLAAVHGIVRINKGFVGVHSVPGVGTQFHVFLPITKKERPAEVVQTAPHQQIRGPLTILVVDDEEMVRKLACITLRRHGYEVLEAGDGKEALRVLANSSALPSLVLLDMAMPIMGGDELLPILEEQYPGLRVVFTSGYPEEDSRKCPRPESVVGFLQKPYTVARLAETIGEALDQSQGNSC